MATWNKEDNINKVFKYCIFLLSPILAFLFSLRTINTRSSYLIFFLCSVFFGLSFTVDESRAYDSSRYKMEFENYKYITEHEFLQEFIKYVTFNEGKKDFYFDTVAFYTSRITDNYHVMFMIFAMVFSFFALKSFKFLTSESNFSASIACFILAYLFMTNQIFNINGVRMWTAGWVAVYAIFQIFRNGNRSYFLLLLTTPYFHGSFWVLIGIVVIALLFRQFERVFVIGFFTSFVVGSIAIELLQTTSDLLPVFLQRMVASYTDPEYVELRNQVEDSSLSLVRRISETSIRIYVSFLVYLFIKNSKVIKGNVKTRNLYLFLLVFMTFVNFTMAVPSLGGRYLLLTYPIIAYIWLVTFKDKKYQRVLYLMPLVFSWSFFSQLVLYRNVLEIDFLVGNPLYLIYKYLIQG